MNDTIQNKTKVQCLLEGLAILSKYEDENSLKLGGEVSNSGKYGSYIEVEIDAGRLTSNDREALEGLGWMAKSIFTGHPVSWAFFIPIRVYPGAV